MAITKLPVDFVDGVVSGNRKYEVKKVSNNEYLIHDVSSYSTVGSRFGSYEINGTRGTINKVIDASAQNNGTLMKIIAGTTTVPKAKRATKVTTANSCSHATSVSSATTAGSANTVSSATSATNADTADIFTTRKINGVDFNGSADITISDSNACDKTQFIKIISDTKLSFTDKEYKVTNSNIKATSLAYLEFAPSSIEEARRCIVSVETYSGYVSVKVGRTPLTDLTASLYIRVI